MARFEFESRYPFPAGEVFGWHERAGAFERLAPPWQRPRVLEREGGIGEGGRLLFEFRQLGLRRRWLARMSGYEQGRRFVDEMERGPMRYWRHEHCFEPEAGGCLLRDGIDFGLLAARADAVSPLDGFVRRELGRLFRFRARRLASDLARHAGRRRGGRYRVGVTGSSGLVGGALCAFLESGGHEVLRLVRRRAEAGPGRAFWNPQACEADGAALEGLDAVVHLAGENIAAGRWTEGRKQRIVQSRVGGTRFLCETLAGLAAPPRVLVCASATGFYGGRGEEEVTESSPPGRGFLADTCVQWEAAADPLRRAGVRVVSLRIGLVVAGAGGALPRMLPIFLAGLGGRLGSGRQWMSWIALDDLLGLILTALDEEGLEGPVNAVAPGALRNGDFTRVLGRVLGRPALLPAPAFALRALLGEMAEALLLRGACVRPARALERGFRFDYPELEDALRLELGRLA